MRRSAWALASVWCCLAQAAEAHPDQFGYQVIRTYPHDPAAFTEGLFYRDGFLYEGTGLKGRSSIRRVNVETGRVELEAGLDSDYFGEGVVDWGDKLIELTYQSQVGLIYDLRTFKPLGRFSYEGEGWGLTQDGVRLIMSDGTHWLRFLSPQTFEETGRIRVTYDGLPVDNLNELEWVKGQIWAVVWRTDIIACIDPGTGVVVGRIDLAGLRDLAGFKPTYDDVLNGVAYDAQHDRLFVTGKHWPKVFEIKLLRKR